MDHLGAPGHFPSRRSAEFISCTQTLCFRHQSGFRYRHNRQGRITMNSKQVVLITGSSTGFGDENHLLGIHGYPSLPVVAIPETTLMPEAKRLGTRNEFGRSPTREMTRRT